MSYVRQIIYLIIYFRYFRNCLVLSICWDIRICSCWLLHFTPLFSRIQAVRLPLCFLVLSGCSPLFVLSAYHESHSFSQPATAVTVSLSLSAMWPASQYSNTHTHTHTHTHTVCFPLFSVHYRATRLCPITLTLLPTFSSSTLSLTHKHLHNLKNKNWYFDHYLKILRLNDYIYSKLLKWITNYFIRNALNKI